MFDSIPPNLPTVGGPIPPTPPPPKPTPSPTPTPIRPTPPPLSPPLSSPTIVPSGAPSGPVSLQQEHVTVMPSKFFIPPKENFPWKKMALWVGIAAVLGLAIVGIAWIAQNRIQSPEVATTPPPTQTPTTPVATTPLTTPTVPPSPLPTTPTTPTATIPPTIPTTPGTIPSTSPNTTSNGGQTSAPGSGTTTPPTTPGTTTTVGANATADVALTDAIDTDHDGLSDEEEAIMGTDATKADTDGDGYSDGNEVLNLYSPNDPDPKKRIWETSAVNKYHHPVFGYELLYPSAWVARSSGDNGAQIIFSSPAGEFVTVSVEKNPSHLSAAEWFRAQYSAQPAPTPIQTKSSIMGAQSTTGLLTVFPFGSMSDPEMIVVQYHGGATGVATYRTLYRMMLASLQDPQKPYWPFSSAPVVPATPPAANP